MNEQLQVALTEILNKTMKGVEAGVGFLQAELPDVIQQLLIWKAAEAAFYSFVGVLMIFASIYGAKRTHKASYDLDETVIPLYMASVGGLFGGCFLIGSNSLTVIQIWLAPKIYLIEYAASLAK